jgi:type I restriction enzyme S subunit
MSERYPASWATCRFDVLVASAHTGLVRSAKEQGPERQFTYLKMNNLSASGGLDFNDAVSVDANESEVEKFSLHNGDFIFNTRNSVELVGKCGVFHGKSGEPILFNNNLLRVNFFHIKPEIIAFWLNSPEGKSVLRSVTSATTSVAAIYQKSLMSLFTPLPPLPEQKQIAAKLDELLAQVDTLKTRLDAIPAILKRFRQSVLATAVSGRLTEEWRQSHGVSKDDWLNLKVGDIVEKIEAGKNLKCIEIPPSDDEYGIIKISAVTWGIFNESESKTLPENRLFVESRRIFVGDFLISRANTIELLGNPVIVHEVTKNLMLSDKVLRLVMSEVDKPWLNIFLRSHVGRKEIESRSTGNQMSMRNIGQKALLDIDIPKPGTEEQTQIVHRVEQLFVFAEQVEQRVKDAQARVNHLTQSILAKAFRGELTAEWREQNPDLISGENSAEALLERIKVEREKMKPVKRARKNAGGFVRA